LAALLTDRATAAVPKELLLLATQQAVLRAAVRPAVATLAQGVLRQMFRERLKAMALPLAVLLMVGLGIGMVLYHFPAAAAPADARPTEIPSTLADPVGFPEGIVDPTRNLAFVTNPQKHIAAVDLQTGKVLWTSTDIGRPLGLAGQYLIAQLENIDRFDPATGQSDAVINCRIGVLDAKADGKPLLKSEPLQVPDKTAEKYGGKFALSNPRVLQGVLQVECRMLGPLPSAKGRIERMQRGSVVARGLAEVDLKTGGAKMDFTVFSETGFPTEVSRNPLAPAFLPEQLRPIYARYIDRGYASNESWSPSVGRSYFSNAPIMAEDSLYEVFWDESQTKGQPRKLVLDRWDLKTGKHQESRTLLEGGAIANALVTLDRRHILASTVSGNKQLCRMFSVISQETKDIPLPAQFGGGWTPSVIGSRMYDADLGKKADEQRNQWVLVPRTLKARDIESGKVFWELPIRPAAIYSGPLPP
jgi:hypothetical protein